MCLVIGWIGACKHEPEAIPVAPAAQNPGGNNPPPVNDSVSFVTEILPLLQSNCTMSGCHDNASAQKGVRLTSYANVISTADVRPGDPDGSDLYKVITETDPDDVMPRPPAQPLTPAQIALIRKWILEGAKNTNINKGCDENVFTYSGAVDGIIAQNCRGCHSGSVPQGGITLATYDDVKTQALSGKLICAINHGSGCVPMPLNGNKLDACRINVVQKWVTAGAPNN